MKFKNGTGLNANHGIITGVLSTVLRRVSGGKTQPTNLLISDFSSDRGFNRNKEINPDLNLIRLL